MIHQVMLLDESGSMGPLRSDVVEGYNQYLGKIRKAENVDQTKLTLAMFDLGGADEKVRFKFVAKDLTKVKDLKAAEYNPRGSTPLNDAVIKTIEKVKSEVIKDDAVLMVIYTDGFENASEADGKTVKKLIAKMEKKGWEFIYLGANQDAWDVGQQYGLSKAGQTYSTQSTGVGTRSAMATIGNIGATSMSNAGKLTASTKTSKLRSIKDEEVDPDKE